jgi:CheY-like chemotaxis protein
VTEQAMSLLLGLIRSLPTFFRAQQAREYIRRPVRDLHGSTVGIVGLGGVGRRVAEVLSAFKTRILATDLFPWDKPAHVEELWPADRLDDLLPLVDIVVLCVPLTSDTRGMMDERRIGLMKKGSILIVEDNIPLATCLEMLLEAHSYEVCRTTDGNGGLKSIKLMDFDVILCDFVMPGLTGDLLYSTVRQLKPHLCDRFIFMTGYPNNPESARFAASTDRPIFWKPFDLRKLLDAINGVMQQNTRKQENAGERREIQKSQCVA